METTQVKGRGGALKLDKSYNFIDKAPYVDELRTWVQHSGRTYKSLADEAGLSITTVGHLFQGKTKRPQARTVQRLGACFGKTLGWL